MRVLTSPTLADKCRTGQTSRRGSGFSSALPNGSTGGNTRYVAKVMVSFPDDLLAKVDRTARLRGTTRSGLLADAVRRELERRDPEAMRAAVQELEALAARYGWPTSADIEAEKKERDERDMRR